MFITSYIIENHKFSGIAFKEFNLNHFNMVSTVHIKSFLNLGRSFSHEYIALPSVKLQISDFSAKKENTVDEYIKQ